MRKKLHWDLAHVLLSRIRLKAKSISHCQGRDLQIQFYCYVSPLFYFITLLPRKPYCMGPFAKHNLKAVSTSSSFAADSIKTLSRPVSPKRVVILSGWKTEQKKGVLIGPELARPSHLPLVFDPGFPANLLSTMRKENLSTFRAEKEVAFLR